MKFYPPVFGYKLSFDMGKGDKHKMEVHYIIRVDQNGNTGGMQFLNQGKCVLLQLEQEQMMMMMMMMMMGMQLPLILLFRID